MQKLQQGSDRSEVTLKKPPKKQNQELEVIEPVRDSFGAELNSPRAVGREL